MNTPWRSMTSEERLTWTVNHWRMLVPALTCVGAAFLMTLPVLTPGPAVPHLAMLAVLVWGLFQPGLMPAYVAFPLGIVTDSLLGLPLGINATLMPVLALATGAFERRFGSLSYILDWAAAACAMLLYQLLSWRLLSLVVGDLPLVPLMMQAATTILAYPLVVAVIARIQRRWVDTR